MRNKLRKLRYYFHTIRFLKPIQIIFRIYYFFFRPKSTTKNVDFEVKQLRGYKHFSTLLPERNSQEEVKYLNEKIYLNKCIDYYAKHNKLLIYNLHYFDYLNSTVSEKYKNFDLKQIKLWIENNKNQKDIGWDPYPTSLRLVNWIKFLDKHKIYDKKIDDSVIKQAEFLSRNIEYHIQANHLFKNLKALLFVMCRYESAFIRKISKKVIPMIIQQVKEQTLDDGYHYEQSPMYHNIFLHDLLDIYNLCSKTNDISLNETAETIKDQIVKSFLASKITNHPDGNIAFFNDSAIGIAPRTDELMEYIKILDINIPDKLDSEILEDAGFIKIIKNKLTLIFKYGSIKSRYQPGHTHGDIASYEVSYEGKRVVVNSGISTYEKSDQRDFERSALSKNTVNINKDSGAEIWSSFRVGRDIDSPVLNFSKESKEICFAYSGFYNQHTKCKHQRKIIFSQNAFEVHDTVSGHKGTPETTINLNEVEVLNESTKSKIFFKSFDHKFLFECSHNFKIYDVILADSFNSFKNGKRIVIELTDGKSRYKIEAL